MLTPTVSNRCSPAWSTPSTPSRATDGPEVAAFALALGRPLIPWQRELANLTGERLESGALAYRRVVMIVPRRAGKSALVLARALATIRRRRAGEHRRAFYTSPHREAAARLWRDDWFPTVQHCELGRFMRITRGNGSEAFAWRDWPGSTFRLVAADGKAIRSAATNLTVIDEAREISPELGADLEASAFPTQATVRDGQTWIVSSAGDQRSAWLARWRDIGRAAVADGMTERVAYVEFAAPEGADPEDEATWFAAHPGLGYHVQLDALRADAAVMTPDAFAAEYLGWWPETLVDERLGDAWAAAATLEPVGAPLVFALDTDEDRTRTDIAVAGAGPDGRITLELIDSRPHGSWVGARLVELAERHDAVALVWDGAGPAAALAPELADVPTRLVPLGTRDVIAAAGALYDGVLAGAIWHRPNVELDAAIPAARRRRAAGAWIFDRRSPGSGPLIAATLAAWIYRSNAARPPTVG